MSDSLVRLVDGLAEDHADETAFEDFGVEGDEPVQVLTWANFRRISRVLAAGWVRMGIEPGDRVVMQLPAGILAKEVELSLIMAAAVFVPVSWKQSADQICSVLEATKARAFVGTWSQGLFDLLGRLADQEERDSSVHFFYADSGLAENAPAEAREVRPVSSAIPEKCRDHVHRMAALEQMGLSQLDVAPECLDRIATDATRPMTALFTSGQTGRSKPVVLDEGNLAAAGSAVADRLSLTSDDRIAHVLPSDQVLGLLSSWLGVFRGARTLFGPPDQEFHTWVGRAATTVLIGVPDTFSQLLLRADPKHKGVRGPASSLWRWARENVATRRRKHLLGTIMSDFASGVVTRAVKQILGTNARLLVCAGGIIPEEAERVLHSTGITFVSGYGTTETCGISHLDAPGKPQPGTVGRALDGIECKLSHEGEILLAGRSVADKTLDGPMGQIGRLFRTGDLGFLDGDRLVITGKKTEVVTPGRQPVSPQILEATLVGVDEIRRAIVVGMGRPHLTAIIEVDHAILWRSLNRRGTTPEDWDVAGDEKAMLALRRAIAKVNKGLDPKHMIHDFRLLPSPRPADEVDATGRLLRPVVTQKYVALIDEMYQPRREQM
ncbi:MAG: AMP-binding protein [Deltaproteobacteria bacterium]|nr:AMP-binding protein [Deltaproteobacteria bacterium]